MNWQELSNNLHNNTKALARCISLVENEAEGYQSFLQQLPIAHTPILGFTGPPGAGKSTLVDALIEHIVHQDKKVAVLCIDPSSPFNLGALLGDRIRMSNWYNHAQVYIRSLASRGSLGGLHPKIIEITEVLKAAQFDYIIVETVGVGQSEIEVAGLADVTSVVLVPEAGDEVQTMKAGLMEIANIFVVNKADRPEADAFVKNLQQMLAPVYKNLDWEVPVQKTIASNKKGVAELWQQIEKYINQNHFNQKRAWLFTQKVFQVIQADKMKGFNKNEIKTFITENPNFNLYQTIAHFNK